MDPYSTGEKLNIKTRKPYTITKQRERWTDDEHNSFLEALKLHGRAWQRIEEHIGTKTAVQIRSHAQKFFTKLEKEAHAKGVPIKQALDMEIPPPRPKRKPNYPYPRKTGLSTHTEVTEKDGKQATLVSSLHPGKCVLDLETKPLVEINGGDEKLENAETTEEVENGTEGPLLSQETPCSENENSISRPIQAGIPSCTFREFIPALEEVINHDETNQSYITAETRKHQKLDQDGIKHTNITSNTLYFAANSHLLNENIVQGQNSDKPSPTTNDIQGVQNYPRHVPVQIVDVNQGISAQENVSFQESTLVNIAASATTGTGHHDNASRCSSYQTVPTFHPLFTHQDDYGSFLHVSPTISSLIVSSLLQNPAAHAAASFAATFWHPANMEASSGDSSLKDELNSETPSMAAIAAATVAAATAWWAAHGLLPVCAPFYRPFSFGTPINGNQTRQNAPEEEAKMDVQHPLSKSAAVCSSEDSDGGGDTKLNTELSVVDTKEMAPVAETIVQKQVDRSSCGSNTTSSSEIETDALEKHGIGKEKEESKELDDMNLVPCNDSISRRSRSWVSPNESWKEVSEEGRLAFQALFSREVLPQSFSHRHNSSVMEKDPELDLNRASWSSHEPVVLRGEEGLLTMGLGNVKLNVHHTGFKPYKRCSIEAKESKIAATSTATQNDDKGPKRMRLDSTLR